MRDVHGSSHRYSGLLIGKAILAPRREQSTENRNIINEVVVLTEGGVEFETVGSWEGVLRKGAHDNELPESFDNRITVCPVVRRYFEDGRFGLAFCLLEVRSWIDAPVCSERRGVQRPLRGRRLLVGNIDHNLVMAEPTSCDTRIRVICGKNQSRG